MCACERIVCGALEVKSDESEACDQTVTLLQGFPGGLCKCGAASAQQRRSLDQLLTTRCVCVRLCAAVEEISVCGCIYIQCAYILPVSVRSNTAPRPDHYQFIAGSKDHPAGPVCVLFVSTVVLQPTFRP